MDIQAVLPTDTPYYHLGQQLFVIWFAVHATYKEHKPNDEDEYNDGGCGDGRGCDRKRLSVDWNVTEGNSNCQQARSHAPNRGYQDSTAADRIDTHHVDPGLLVIFSTDSKTGFHIHVLTMRKLVPATTSPTATGFEKPTSAKSVDE